ncbi:hypothetical protein Cpir12675_002739 [Ceratocystis pirilliformis]|uniref:Uncharacterized protein n=1 Tax=Ceratocystis pirilliformis TaxID=259994 RepID=A0ABR3Z7T4_9PEZI
MLPALLLTTLYLFLFYTPVAALQVTPGSPCAQHCIDNTADDPFSAASSSTTASDIVCTDAAFGTEGTGARFRECVECLQKSGKVNGTESDLHWLLYNLRFALSTCLYNPDVLPESQRINSPCLIPSACQPLEPAITQGDINASTTAAPTSMYEYCAAGSGDLLEETWEEPCVSCLQSTTDQYYLSNFLSVLKGACAQRPEAGTLLGIAGDIFSRDAINTTVATEDSSTSTGGDSGGMNTPIIVGISVGASLVLVGGIGLFWVYFQRKKHFERTSAAGAASATAHLNHSEIWATSISKTVGSESIPMYSTSQSAGSAYGMGTKERASTSMDTKIWIGADGRVGHEYYDLYENLPPGFAFGYARSDPGVLVPHPAYIPGCSSRTTSPGSLPSQSPTQTLSQSPSQSSVSSGTFLVPSNQDKRPQVPALIMPSSSQYRQKKYLPPQITIQSASPITEEDESHSLAEKGANRPKIT